MAHLPTSPHAILLCGDTPAGAAIEATAAAEAEAAAAAADHPKIAASDTSARPGPILLFLGVRCYGTTFLFVVICCLGISSTAHIPLLALKKVVD